MLMLAGEKVRNVGMKAPMWPFHDSQFEGEEERRDQFLILKIFHKQLEHHVILETLKCVITESENL